MNVETLRGAISFPNTLDTQRSKFRKNQFSQKQHMYVAKQVHILPLSEFLIAHLHFWRGWTLSEISSRFELPYAQVLRLHKRALKKLKRMCQKQFGKTKRGKIKAGLRKINLGD